MLLLIRKNLIRKKVQTFSLLLSIIISTAMFSSLFLMYTGVNNGLQISEKRLGADLMAVPRKAQSQLTDKELLLTGIPAMVYMPEHYVDEIKQLVGVTRVTTQFFGQTLNASCCSSKSAVRLIGYDPKTDWIIEPWIQENICHELEEDEIIIGSEVDGYDDRTGTILGHDVRVAGVMEPSGTGMDSSILMNIDVVRKYSRESEEFSKYWEEFGDPGELVSTILVNVEEGTAGSVSNLIEITGNGELLCVKSSDVIGNISSQMNTLFRIMLVAAILFMVGSLVQMLGRFYSMAWDRRCEMGLYRAIGASKLFLKKMIITEASILSLMGGITGILSGIGLFMIFDRMIRMESTFTFVMPDITTILTYGSGLMILVFLLGILSVLVPVKQCDRIDPMLAMQKSDID